MAATCALQVFEEQGRVPVSIAEDHEFGVAPRPELISRDLLRRIGGGDEKALGLAYERASRVVFGVALRMLRNEAEAEEVVVDVFLQVWRKAADFDPDRGSPTSWLLMIARSRVIDRFRSNRLRRCEQTLDEFELPASGHGPQENSAIKQVGRRVRAALEQLPCEQQKAIELAYFEGMSHSEIAHKVGAPLGTIKTRIRLAMLRLRELLGSELLEEFC
jgi:RNA polymerase sigma-70 factor (ECF subfamily)